MLIFYSAGGGHFTEFLLTKITENLTKIHGNRKPAFPLLLVRAKQVLHFLSAFPVGFSKT